MLCFQNFQSSAFARLEWRGWGESAPEYAESRLHDLGLEVSDLFEEGTLYIDNTGSIRVKSDYIRHFLRECGKAAVKLEKWRSALEEHVGTPLYWYKDTGSGDCPNEATDEQNHYIFPCLRIAHLMMLYWPLRLVISHLAEGLWASKPRPDTVNAQENLETFEERLFDHGDATRVEIALKILRSTPYCTTPDKGFVGLSRIIWALRVAMYTFENCDVRKVLETRAWLEFLNAEKGVKFAGDVARTKITRWSNETQRSQLTFETFS